MSKMKAVQLDDPERLLIIDQTRLPSEPVSYTHLYWRPLAGQFR